jgi:hypothetical protein
MRAYHNRRWSSDQRTSERLVLNRSHRSTVGTGRGEVILLPRLPDLRAFDVFPERNQTKTS